MIENIETSDIVVLYTTVCVVTVVLVVWYLTPKTGTRAAGSCTDWQWKSPTRKNPCASADPGASVSAFSSSNYNSATRIIPKSFIWSTPKMPSGARAVSTSPVAIPPKPFNIATLDSSGLEKLRMPLNINYSTGFQSLGIDIPLYDHNLRQIITISAILDTGSNFILVPTNLCQDKTCTNIFGLWNGSGNCFVKNNIDPMPVLSYGSGKVHTRVWRTPMVVNNHGISVDFKGIIRVSNVAMRYFPALCGMLPTYPELGDDVSFVDQVLGSLSKCVRGFVLDLTAGHEAITFGEINTGGKRVSLLSDSDYIDAQINVYDRRPILFYAVKLVKVLVNGVECGGGNSSFATPKYAILDTGTSGMLVGIDSSIGDVNTDFVNCINVDATIVFVLENDARLTIVNKKTSNNIQGGSTGLLDSILIGLPALVNTVTSYDLDGRCLYFNS